MTDEPQGTVLVVEDDDATRTFLADNLSADGYEPLPAGDAHDARRLLETKFPDAAIVDVGLSGPSGLDLVAAVRTADGLTSKINAALPVIVLSGRSDELDRLRAYERGADVFLAKPFAYPELRAQLAALLRRVDQSRRPGRVRVGDLEVDPSSRTVTVRGDVIELSQKEYALLRVSRTGHADLRDFAIRRGKSWAQVGSELEEMALARANSGQRWGSTWKAKRNNKTRGRSIRQRRLRTGTRASRGSWIGST